MPIGSVKKRNAREAEPEAFGRVISVQGSKAGVALPASSSQHPEDERATVGRLLGIRAGAARIIGMITDASLRTQIAVADGPREIARAHLDLIGEIRDPDTSSARFRRGVTIYPAIGDPVTFVSKHELRLIFDLGSSDTVEIGRLQQDAAIGTFVNVSEMLSKHFAVLGTTGVGKSSAIALMLRQILEARSDVRVLLLDAHNEYGRSFGDKAQVLNPGNIRLPFWLFSFEEIVDIFFGERPGLEEQIDLLGEMIPLAKAAYAQGGSFDRFLTRKTDVGGLQFTADTPVPYRMGDLLSLLDVRMGKLENRLSRMTYHKLITRIEAVWNDPRYAFMFENANVGGDTMAEILSSVFGLSPRGVPITILQLAGFPSEVVDAVVSVLCRMAFDLGLWTDGTNPMVVVCEEAHRYIAADRNVGFGPTRRSISRIAKEGRKYGVFLGLVSQRPAELDPTILSQCSTIFAMRMTNDRDRALLQAAVADSAANLLSFLPSLSTGETLVFGEGVALPTRLRFNELPPDCVPKNEAGGLGRKGRFSGPENGSLASIIDQWRGVATRSRLKPRNSQEEVSTRDDAGLPQTQGHNAASSGPAGAEPDNSELSEKRLQFEKPLGH